MQLRRSLWDAWGFGPYTPGERGVLAVHQCVEIAARCSELRARRDPQVVLATAGGTLAVGTAAHGLVRVGPAGIRVDGAQVLQWRLGEHFDVLADGTWRRCDDAAWLAGYAKVAEVLVLDAHRAWGGALDVVARLAGARAVVGGLPYRYAPA